MIPRSTAQNRLEPVLVFLVALHSYGVGLFLLFGTGFALRLGGWEPGGEFFVRQGGAFHLVIATVYLLAYARRESVLAIVVAKSFAVVFLGAMVALGEPLLVGLSAVADGLMLISVLLVRSRRRPSVGLDPF